MTATLSFVVPGPPVPKGRPRRGVAGQFYTPRQTGAYEKHVRALSLGAVARYRWRRDTAARYAVTVRAWMPSAKRVDIDNLLKSCVDGLMPFVLPDDSQIDEMHGYKGVDADDPRAEIEVTQLA